MNVLFGIGCMDFDFGVHFRSGGIPSAKRNIFVLFIGEIILIWPYLCLVSMVWDGFVVDCMRVDGFDVIVRDLMR